jgi:hypothetical protein
MIECIETYDDRLKTEGQLLLNACLELERPPRHACFFDFSATGIDAAHDNDMRVSGFGGGRGCSGCGLSPSSINPSVD